MSIGVENIQIDENYARMNPDAKPDGYVPIVVRGRQVSTSRWLRR